MCPPVQGSLGAPASLSSVPACYHQLWHAIISSGLVIIRSSALSSDIGGPVEIDKKLRTRFSGDVYATLALHAMFAGTDWSVADCRVVRATDLRAVCRRSCFGCPGRSGRAQRPRRFTTEHTFMLCVVASGWRRAQALKSSELEPSSQRHAGKS